MHPTEVLARHRAELARRVTQTQASMALIDHALACPHEDFLDCANFQAMVHELAEC